MSKAPDIDRILALAAMQGIENIGKRTFNTIRKEWIAARGQYGFTYTPDEAKLLKESLEHPTYVAFKKCIGNYRHLKFIKVGLLIFELRRKGDIARIKEIKSQVYNSRYGVVPNKLIHLATLGILPSILDYLTDLKTINKMSKSALQREFQKLLDKWKEISICVDKDTTQSFLKSEIKLRMKKEYAQIIVYGAGRASHVAHRVIADMKNKQKFSGRYLDWSKNIPFSEKDIQFICFLYSLNFGVDTPFG